MAYIHFTDEQKQQAATVNLPEFLRRQGEKLLPAGREYRLDRDHSVTVRGNTWYDHASSEGGGPVSFLQNFFGLSYPEAMSRLLEGAVDAGLVQNSDRESREVQPFTLPPASDNMRRLYAYLLKERCISREVVNAFVQAKLLYESLELARDGAREYHNAVFVGLDENCVPRHAHKRSLNSVGKSFRMNEAGSDPCFSFHHTGTSDRLFVFEAPIDLLSFITLNPKDWKNHSYVSLCGTADHALRWMLDQNPVLEKITLCLDHDEAGIEATGQLREMLSELGYPETSVIQPCHKDFNEDLKAVHGRIAKPAEEHPQFIVAPEVCRRIGKIGETVNLSRLQSELPSLLEQHRRFLQWNRTEDAMDCAERMAAFALSACAREMRQTGVQASTKTLSEVLRQYIQPHQNRANVRSRHYEI
ncbi:MAG: DUF3991 and TOPRIM domain-containing protein, partial [Clostridia bacterium]|nr:DUF3991 and TOPRIM domain-containing protein [Clostridia bacterium]